MEEAVSKVIDILSGIRPDVNFESEERLIDGNVLDSFDVVTIVAELEDAFGIEIDIDDIDADNFNSAAAIEAYVSRKSGTGVQAASADQQ